jgi:hypothetical protein
MSFQHTAQILCKFLVAITRHLLTLELPRRGSLLSMQRFCIVCDCACGLAQCVLVCVAHYLIRVESSDSSRFVRKSQRASHRSSVNPSIKARKIHSVAV